MSITIINTSEGIKFGVVGLENPTVEDMRRLLAKEGAGNPDFEFLLEEAHFQEIDDNMWVAVSPNGWGMYSINIKAGPGVIKYWSWKSDYEDKEEYSDKFNGDVATRCYYGFEL